MNGIIGLTELTLETELAGEQRNNLGMVLSSAQTLLSLINEILDFSKIEANKLTIEEIPFPLRECFHAALTILAPRAFRKGLEFAIDIHPDVPNELMGDPVRIGQILLNLAGNAIKFTEEGEVVISVRKVSQEGEQVVLHCTVRDTGIGVSAEKHDMIFDAFSQADNSTTRKFGGTGLGLVITKRLVEMMKGRIWVESELGQGSTFHLVITLDLQQGKSVIQETPFLRYKNLPVLVVDDNATNRHIFETILSKWMMKPTLVEDGQAALEAVDVAERKGDPFGLILLDYQMPEMDGICVVKHMKKKRHAINIPIILLTSSTEIGLSEKCRAAGIIDYLIKPVLQTQLRDVIIQVLEKKKTQPEIRQEPDSDAPRNAGGKLHVLLAEDNLINQHLVKSILEKEGHKVTIVGNGVEAVAEFNEHPFDLIIMDVQMPKMNGFEAVSVIRDKEQQTGQRTPIIAATAHAMEKDKQRCLEAGMNAYIAKPINSKKLLELIDTMILKREHLPTSDGETATTGDSSLSVSLVTDRSVIDYQELQEVFSNDKTLLTEIIDHFLHECPENMASIIHAFEHNNLQELASVAHLLKGSLANLYATSAYAAVSQLEAAARNNDRLTAKGAVKRLNFELDRLTASLKEINNVHRAA